MLQRTKYERVMPLTENEDKLLFLYRREKQTRRMDWTREAN